jgi:Asp-tRNA(Asn)/Glu-tRNA(Gln) amidotransferase A subunit family amidase
VAQHAATYRKTPEKLGPNVRDNVAFGLTFTVERIAAAQTAHTKLFRRFNAFMEAYDLMITPAAAVSPFPVEQLYCAEIDGVTLNNYYHWLAIAYGVTLTGHPAAVIPCGVDENGLPFCIQLVGKRGADGFVMRAAQALETALAGDNETRRPMPDLAKLMAAAKTPPPFKKPY